jgi:hypothetical protein
VFCLSARSSVFSSPIEQHTLSGQCCAYLLLSPGSADILHVGPLHLGMVHVGMVKAVLALLLFLGTVAFVFSETMLSVMPCQLYTRHSPALPL